MARQNSLSFNVGFLDVPKIKALKTILIPTSASVSSEVVNPVQIFCITSNNINWKKKGFCFLTTVNVILFNVY